MLAACQDIHVNRVQMDLHAHWLLITAEFVELPMVQIPGVRAPSVASQVLVCSLKCTCVHPEGLTHCQGKLAVFFQDAYSRQQSLAIADGGTQPGIRAP